MHVNYPDHRTNYIPRDANTCLHANLSHQVQSVHVNYPDHRTNYIPRDANTCLHANLSHQVQSVHVNYPDHRTNSTSRRSLSSSDNARTGTAGVARVRGLNASSPP